MRASDAALPQAMPDADADTVRRLRGPRAAVDPLQPIAVWDEWEVMAADRPVPSRVVLLAGGECRFTCAMCDLWKHTLDHPTPAGSLPAQLRRALAAPGALGLERATSPAARWIKLYNGSNFFDPRSVPRRDLPEIARAVTGWERVIVENHPRLTGPAVPRFRDACAGRLEVAMGLETVHPRILPWLGKQMTAADFAAASGRLRTWDIDVRGFVLLGLPGLSDEEAVGWCVESVVFAARAGARHVSIIPTRPGNGLFDDLARRGLFAAPQAATVERAAACAIDAAGTSVLVTIDLWGWDALPGHCATCRDLRRERLNALNLAQRVPPPSAVSCGCLAEHRDDA